VLRKDGNSCKKPLLDLNPLVLQAEALLDEGTLAATQAALAKWRDLLDVEPRSVRATCGVAQSYSDLALCGISNSSLAVARALEAAGQAVQLDCDTMLPLLCMGSALTLSRRWHEAEISFKQAIALGGHAGTYRQYAIFLAARERFREAWNYIQRAQQIDPFSCRQKVLHTRLRYLCQRYEAGAAYAAEEVVYGRLTDEAELYRAMILVSHNQRSEAMRIALDLCERAVDQTVIMSGVAEILATCGDSSAAGRIAGDCDLFAANSPLSKFRQTLLLVALGNRDEAISLLSAAYEEHEAELIWLACEPRFTEIRKDSRFILLLKGVQGDSP
jgi:tetratricopeptide (TPR) repeat protein